jgi:hypothetical protein
VRTAQLSRPATTSDPSRFASAAHRATLFRPEVAQPQEDESPKVASSGGNPMEEAADPREDRDALAPCAEDGEVAEQNLRWTGLTATSEVWMPGGPPRHLSRAVDPRLTD